MPFCEASSPLDPISITQLPAQAHAQAGSAAEPDGPTGSWCAEGEPKGIAKTACDPQMLVPRHMG